jgi:hypothetical protein
VSNHAEVLTIVQWYMVDYGKTIRKIIAAGMGTLDIGLSGFAGEIASRGMTEKYGEYGFCNESSNRSIQSEGFWHRKTDFSRYGECEGLRMVKIVGKNTSFKTLHLMISSDPFIMTWDLKMCDSWST